MNIVEFEIIKPLVGGMAIGLGSAILMLSIGRIAGISGIVEGILRPRSGDWDWRIIFVVGLLFGGFLMYSMMPERFVIDSGRSLMMVGAAGLLVGFGVHIGCGCTSGHGVCGISRISMRSLVAVPTFMLSGAIVVWLIRTMGVGA